MIKRFEGIDGEKRLVEALRAQRIIEGDEVVALELQKVVSLRTLKPSEVLITEGASDNDLYFILSGKIAITVTGRPVAYRLTGEHVGEMSFVDPMANRSATAVAEEETVIAKVSERDFSELANSHPRIWRLIARALCSRLRQRNSHVRPVNETPVLFVGSSTESLPIAREIQAGLVHDKVLVKLWTDKVFGASRFPIEDLETAISGTDFALFVIGPDDEVISRTVRSDAPRDNVILELGMGFGAISRSRTFLLKPRGVDIKIPTDLLGLTPLEFTAGDPTDLASHLGPVCNELRARIQNLGSR